MKQAVILAGGKGTRLKERLGGLPKPLVDVCGQPLLEHQVLLAKRFGFTQVLVLVNHAADQIVEFCRSRANWGLSVECIDDGEPRGTAGATLAAFDRLAEEFLLMYGDTMLEVDLDRFHTHHRHDPGAAATLFLHPNDHPADSDLVELDERDRVVAFHPYPHDQSRYYPNLVNAALYWINRAALRAWAGTRGSLDFGKDLFPAMLRQGLTLRGYNSPEYIKDAGTPERLDRVCADHTSGRIAQASLIRAQPIVFLDRDGTINHEVHHLSSDRQLRLLPGVEQAIKRLNRSEYRCCVVTNQPVIARGDCSVEALRMIHNKMDTLLGAAGAYVDRLYYCPHHPDKGFPGERPELKFNCGCRKPALGMIERAMAEFNGDLRRSWLIGDSSVDIETARRARLKSILVETGHAGLDYRYWAVPDFVAPDLNEAVTFILDVYPRLQEICVELVRGLAESSIVLIGGQSRSGKSTLARVLADAIEAAGTPAKVISIDRWLRSEALRTAGVCGRYDIEAVQEIANALACRRAGISLTLPGYQKLTRQRIEDVEELSIDTSDVVIIEGVLALNLRVPADTARRRFYIEVDENIRRQRLVREYVLRGLSEQEAITIYEARLDEEFDVIARTAGSATRILLPEGTA